MGVTQNLDRGGHEADDYAFLMYHRSNFIVYLLRIKATPKSELRFIYVVDNENKFVQIVSVLSIKFNKW